MKLMGVVNSSQHMPANRMMITDREALSPFDEVSNKGQWERIIKAIEFYLLLQ